jgi:undecaprenyl phosphate-alpha-L-ara4FN deformylase
MRVGLRIDVDTLRGTRQGVPQLLTVLAREKVRASFFFSVGPDNMGRHLFRLLRPAFLKKMLRTRAPGLYGWDIVLRGTLGPGPDIARRTGDVIARTSRQGHEVGLHAWDHWAWQARIGRMTPAAIRQTLRRGVDRIAALTGRVPACSAVPAWKCTDTVLEEKEKFPFTYNSDCRGTSIFYPVVAGRRLNQPQIPVTLPTFDEVVGQAGVTAERFNDDLLARLKSGGLNVLTIHAEVEGIACLPVFRKFLHKAADRGVSLVPLGELLPAPADIPPGVMAAAEIPGREGWLSLQGAGGAP